MDRISFHFVFIALLFMSCSSARREGPPLVDYGRTECARCGMIVSEERFASGYFDEDGRSVVFDDVAEMLDAVSQNPSVSNRVYVHDASGFGWLLAKEAFYIRAPALPTPMGSGVAAFKNRQDADAIALDHKEGPIDFLSALNKFAHVAN